MMRQILLGLVILLAPPALAEVLHFDHNGSLMAVDQTGDHVLITYLEPRPAIARQGVSVGQLLFNGRVQDGYLEGQARIFSGVCGAIDYFVYGDYTPGRAFRLQGAAPRLNKSDCSIINHDTSGANSNLLFTPVEVRTQGQALRGCLRGVNTTLNMRVGPNADHAVIAEIPAKSCAVEQLRCQDDWCLVAHQGDLGWVARRFLAR